MFTVNLSANLQCG